jgi:DnaJ family protein A protein 2
LRVTLEDLYNGKTAKLSLMKTVLCAKCDGRGGKEGSVQTCSSCRGQGVKAGVAWVRSCTLTHSLSPSL